MLAGAAILSRFFGRDSSHSVLGSEQMYEDAPAMFAPLSPIVESSALSSLLSIGDGKLNEIFSDYFSIPYADRNFELITIEVPYLTEMEVSRVMYYETEVAMSDLIVSGDGTSACEHPGNVCFNHIEPNFENDETFNAMLNKIGIVAGIAAFVSMRPSVELLAEGEGIG